jgi:hypothetical protein
MGAFTKQDAPLLRDLRDRAYRVELGLELAKLEGHFRRWRQGDIEPGDLASLIHEFHDGANRDLYKLYNSRDLGLAVARAIALGLLEPSDVSAELLTKLQHLIDHATENLR